VTVRWVSLPQAPQDQSSEGYVLEASTAADFSGVIVSSRTSDVLVSTLGSPKPHVGAEHHLLLHEGRGLELGFHARPVSLRRRHGHALQPAGAGAARRSSRSRRTASRPVDLRGTAGQPGGHGVRSAASTPRTSAAPVSPRSRPRAWPGRSSLGSGPPPTTSRRASPTTTGSAPSRP